MTATKLEKPDRHWAIPNLVDTTNLTTFEDDTCSVLFQPEAAGACLKLDPIKNVSNDLLGKNHSTRSQHRTAVTPFMKPYFKCNVHGYGHQIERRPERSANGVRVVLVAESLLMWEWFWPDS